MPDRRPVDQVSTQELERILAIRKREERVRRLRRLEVQGRVAPMDQPEPETGDALPAFDTGGRYRSVEVGL
jgi:hypothetical protein